MAVLLESVALVILHVHDGNNISKLKFISFIHTMWIVNHGDQYDISSSFAS